MFITNYHKSWNKFISCSDIVNELETIEKQIGKEIIDYFPKEENVLRFLSLDLSKIKYIIVGMEPYPSYYKINDEIIPEATGRSFEVNSVTSWEQKFKQTSLRNILKTIYLNEFGEKITIQELRNKIIDKSFLIKNPKDWFLSLERQGILFLNATLTVKPNEVNSHTLLWTYFMTELIQYIEKENSEIIWLLWGKDAQNRVIPNLQKNNYICSCHPRLAEFVDENCFQYIKNINWKG